MVQLSILESSELFESLCEKSSTRHWTLKKISTARPLGYILENKLCCAIKISQDILKRTNMGILQLHNLNFNFRTHPQTHLLLNQQQHQLRHQLIPQLFLRDVSLSVFIRIIFPMILDGA